MGPGEVGGPTRPRPPLLVGIGTPDRGDDAFGLLVARRLRQPLLGRCEVVECVTEGTELLDLWEGRGNVWVADAVRGGRPPGTVYRFAIGPHPLPSPLTSTSSHSISLGSAIALGIALGRMPRSLVVHGVEPERWEVGAPLSPPVASAIDRISLRIDEEIRQDLPSVDRRSPDA